MNRNLKPRSIDRGFFVHIILAAALIAASSIDLIAGVVFHNGAISTARRLLESMDVSGPQIVKECRDVVCVSSVGVVRGIRILDTENSECITQPQHICRDKGVFFRLPYSRPVVGDGACICTRML